MKNFLRTIAVIAPLLFTNQIKAQEKLNASSLLWEVSGKGLSKPSYIYGTIHMICAADFILQDKTKNALGHADKLVMELDFTNPTEISELQKTMISAIPLSKKLNPAQFARLDSILLLKTGLHLKTMDQLTLTALSSFVISKTLPCTEIKYYELEFAELAKAQNKQISALETVKQQADYFSKAFTDESLIEQIVNFDDYKSVFREMIDAYRAENLVKLYEIMQDKRFGNTDESNKWLLQVRNANWVKQMPEMMEQKSCFFAVGSGHLPGNGGILQLLKAQGFTVKPLLN